MYKTFCCFYISGYNDPDFDAPKSQPSSGRSSPFLDGEGSRSGSPAKIPPRPPPPKTILPQRPPPPKVCFLWIICLLLSMLMF